MPVVVGIRVNPWLRAYYRRLRAAGKRPKVAIIAAMHKLLAAIYSVAKHRRPFVSKGLHQRPGRDAQAELTLQR
jgi:transposase